MQLASHANEAYRVLSSDCSRAAYLCRSHGVAPDGPDAAPPSASLLEQQMHWHEALEAALKSGDAAAITQLSKEVAHQRNELLSRIAQLLDVSADYRGAAQAVRSLMFLEKMAAEVDRAAADREATAAEE